MRSVLSKFFLLRTAQNGLKLGEQLHSLTSFKWLYDTKLTQKQHLLSILFLQHSSTFGKKISKAGINKQLYFSFHAILQIKSAWKKKKVL